MDEPHQPTRLHTIGAEEEDLAAFLKRRERTLIQQAAALRGMLAPKEEELARVRKAMEAVGVKPDYVEALRPFLDPNRNPYSPALDDSYNPYAITDRAGTPLPAFVESMTIKEMILRALADHFRDGATPSELRDYIRTAYGREVDRNSISPQLARLREEGIVMQPHHPPTGKWSLLPGKNALREEEDLLAAAEKLAWTSADNEAAQKSETPDTKPKASHSARIGGLVIKRRI